MEGTLLNVKFSFSDFHLILIAPQKSCMEPSVCPQWLSKTSFGCLTQQENKSFSFRKGHPWDAWRFDDHEREMMYFLLGQSPPPSHPSSIPQNFAMNGVTGGSWRKKSIYLRCLYQPRHIMFAARTSDYFCAINLIYSRGEMIQRSRYISYCLYISFK